MRRASHVLWAVGLMFAFCLLAVPRAHADNLGAERDKTKQILNVVAKEIEKEYYDPKLKGVDWKAAVDDARKRIDNAQDVGSMMTAIYALVNKLHDSHTMFFPPQRSTRVIFGFEARMYGDEARIYKVRENGPADKAGLKPGDRLFSVNGHMPDRPTFGLMMLNYRVLRPAPVMDLEIMRDQKLSSLRLQGDIRKLAVVRQIATEEDIEKLYSEADTESEEYRKEHQYHYGMQDGIGYIQLPYFFSDKDFLHALLQDSKGAKAMIVDLRGNGGGSTETLATLAGFFEQEPTVIADIVSRKKTEPIKVKPLKPNFQVPMYILMDSGSASASEIFAKHFQSTKHATVIGDQSAGAVMAARVFPQEIGAGSVIYFNTEITVGRVVFPGGVELENQGVVPDRPCLPSSEAMRNNVDTCLNMARSLAKQAIAQAK